ncbi:PP2A-like protein phosphatase [Encephalitozoon hellem ATCC 50504]|uniref:Serine/threonine-protein phosphatase n=1 Tax=Encephalitozoon hellem TaxID=27973 RepID=A0A9Q9CE28_ENCHE|nr:PP2A-like protein phosphatase [Encephalitozoon hellem ATCC 50504]AFM99222.1 PP2A-like protein phosphatase [Encephalitozoon hellem ATCC 50504]UTX44209.1 Ser/Thr protein phosphatase 5 [Encephalitozoon hellem]WEL39700.1 ser/thr protein phosphatase PP-1A [Encephalitozoon hellem]|eukprot:XP_003888203.1 PP2A-like protein phosphatase [Encephalitozoon hellem ATCC 50504]
MTNGPAEEKHLAMLENIKNSILPSREEALLLVREVRKILESEPNILHIDTPVNVVGDVHGHFYDVLNMLSLMEDPSEKPYLFLGDYVDRGYNSVDLILLLFAYKRLYKNNLYLLRGNHETRMLSSVYGFKEECVRKYDLIVYWRICEAFQYLPVAAIVLGKYFCVHGGLIPGMSSDFIMNHDRVGEVTEINDILWSDPDETPGFQKSQRGAGYLFGEDVLKKFLDEHGMLCFVRSHQLVSDGYKAYFGERLYTVWGAPNYCYSSGNIACVMAIDESGHDFRLFDRCEEQFKEVPMRCDFFGG